MLILLHWPCIFIYTLLLDLIASLELVDLRVPTQVLLGTRTMLQCHWSLSPKDTLYSVKWYKDGKEFFRYVPRDVEPRRRYPLPGVDVEEFNVSGSNLTLAPAVLKTSGRYRCEVSGERPRFHTVSEYANMLVISLPTEGPTISGFQFKYYLGNHVKVNCTSGKSRPAIQLSWYINGEPASVVVPIVSTDGDGLMTSTSGLAFKIEEQHMTKNLTLKCLATLASIYWRSVEESAVVFRGSVQDNNSKQNTEVTTSGTIKTSTKTSSLSSLPLYLCGLFYIVCEFI